MSSVSLLALLLLATGGSALQVSVAEVQNYSKLASWENSSLYRVEANTGYETNPLLIHLVGSRYGENILSINLVRAICKLGASALSSLSGRGWHFANVKVMFCPSDIGYAYGFLLSKEIQEAYHCPA